MRSIKSCLIRRQRPRQFSYDCWGFDFSGCIPVTCGFILLSDQVEPGPHFAPSLLPEKPKRASILAATGEERQGVCGVPRLRASLHPLPARDRPCAACIHLAVIRTRAGLRQEQPANMRERGHAMPGTRPRTDPRHNNGCRERPEHINRPEIEPVRNWAAALRRAHWARLPRVTPPPIL